MPPLIDYGLISSIDVSDTIISLIFYIQISLFFINFLFVVGVPRVFIPKRRKKFIFRGLYGTTVLSAVLILKSILAWIIIIPPPVEDCIESGAYIGHFSVRNDTLEPSDIIGLFYCGDYIISLRMAVVIIFDWYHDKMLAKFTRILRGLLIIIYGQLLVMGGYNYQFDFIITHVFVYLLLTHRGLIRLFRYSNKYTLLAGNSELYPEQYLGNAI